MQASKTIHRIFTTKMTFPRRKYLPRYGAKPSITLSLVVTMLKSRCNRFFETLTDTTGRMMPWKSMNETQHSQF
jgi:hypothetical protein